MIEEIAPRPPLIAPPRPPLVRLGAVAAILGSIAFMAAGVAFGNLTNESTPRRVLETLAGYSSDQWPAIQFAFVTGAFLWVVALTILSWTLTSGASRAWGKLGAATILVGAAIHIVDSAVSGYGLGMLARSWAASRADHAVLLPAAHALMRALGGLWAAVLVFFHGFPFIFFGLAVARSPRYPTWWGYVGALGGVGSVVTGVPMLFGRYLVSLGFYIPFAVLGSIWMMVMGILMWRRRGWFA